MQVLGLLKTTRTGESDRKYSSVSDDGVASSRGASTAGKSVPTEMWAAHSMCAMCRRLRLLSSGASSEHTSTDAQDGNRRCHLHTCTETTKRARQSRYRGVEHTIVRKPKGGVSTGINGIPWWRPATSRSCPTQTVLPHRSDRSPKLRKRMRSSKPRQHTPIWRVCNRVSECASVGESCTTRTNPPIVPGAGTTLEAHGTSQSMRRSGHPSQHSPCRTLDGGTTVTGLHE